MSILAVRPIGAESGQVKRTKLSPDMSFRTSGTEWAKAAVVVLTEG